MVLRLGNFADAPEEVKGGHEVLDPPLAADALAVVGQLPAGHRGEVLAHLRRFQRGQARLAGRTALLRQVRCRKGHGWPPYRARARVILATGAGGEAPGLTDSP